jgi:TolB-like protein/tetratricopeptide (TPR) repeat protein
VATRSAPAPAAPTPAPDRIRLVVLPVANLTGGDDGDLVADGLTDAIIAELGQLSPRRLAVIARTSAMSYRNAPRPLPEIGRALDVGFIVETSLRRENGALRVNSQVVPVRDQTPLASFSETFGGDTSGASSESQVAIRVSRFVVGVLLPAAAAAAPPPTSRDRAAWDAVTRGRALLHRGTPDEVGRSIAEFDAATEADPSFAAAWAASVEARHLSVMMGAARPRDAYPAARIAADRARAAQPTLSEAHLAHGLVTLWFDQDPAGAAASFARALELNASSAAAHHDYAWALLALGRDEQAIAEITMARDLDPLSARANTDIGWLYLQLNRPADAERACQHTLAIHPKALEPQACLERAYAARGLWEPALQAARTTVPVEVFHGAAERGRRAEETLRALWQWRLERLEEASRTRWISPYTLAVQHVLVGQHDRALAQLTRARDEQVGMLLFLPRDPALAPLRSDTRFTALTAGRPAS